jgi:integrase
MPYVIAGRKEGSRLIGLRRVWVRVAMAAGLYEDLDTGKKDRAGKPVMRRALKYRLHDLRHSFASVGAGAGLGLPIIGALLGHTQAATTARYAHLADDPLRQASDAIGRRIDAAMKGANNAGAEIVPFQKAGAT